MLFQDDLASVQQGISLTESLCESNRQWAFEVVGDVRYSTPNIFVPEGPKWLCLAKHRYSIFLWLLGLQAKLGASINLQKLWIWNQPMAFVHENIQYLSELQWLQLRCDDKNILQPTALPRSLGQLHNLKTLILIMGDLQELPLGLGSLSRLEMLSVSHSPIKTLPEDLALLSQLEHLCIRKTGLSALPRNLSLLHRLKVLDLSNNQLTHIPETLLELPALQNLKLEGNPLYTLSEKLKAFVGAAWIQEHYPEMLH